MVYEAYRGQHGLKKGKIHTRLPSITFSSFDAAVLYAHVPNNRNDVVVKPIVLKAVIRIDNPLFDYDDSFCDLGHMAQKLGFDFMWHMAVKYEDFIYDTNNWDENFSDKYDCVEDVMKNEPHLLYDLYMEAYPLLDDAELVAQAKAHGYDGAIHMGSGDTYDDKEYRIFSEEQIIHLEVVPDEMHAAA